LQYQTDVGSQLDCLKKDLVEKVDEVQAACDADILVIRRKLANYVCGEECVKLAQPASVPKQDTSSMQRDSELHIAGSNGINQLVLLNSEMTDGLPEDADSASAHGCHTGKLYAPPQTASRSGPCSPLHKVCRTNRRCHTVESSTGDT